MSLEHLERDNPRGHLGVDIAGELDVTPVLANRDGIVRSAGPTGGDAGWLVEIDHAGNRETGYAHLQANSIPAGVVTGARVVQGQRIGTVGDTRNDGDTPPHLHFRVREIIGNERAIRDPEYYLNNPCP